MQEGVARRAGPHLLRGTAPVHACEVCTSAPHNNAQHLCIPAMYAQVLSTTRHKCPTQQAANRLLSTHTHTHTHIMITFESS